MVLVEAVVAVFCVLSIIFFAMYVASLFRQPTGRRPDTPTMDRLGRPLPPSPNPGYAETEDETQQ